MWQTGLCYCDLLLFFCIRDIIWWNDITVYIILLSDRSRGGLVAGTCKLPSSCFLLFLKPIRAQIFGPTFPPPPPPRKPGRAHFHFLSPLQTQIVKISIQNSILIEFLGSKNYNLWIYLYHAILCIHDMGLFVCLFVLNSDGIQSSGITWSSLGKARRPYTDGWSQDVGDC